MLNFVDQYVNRALPHVMTARDVATAYAERIIALLDAIRDAVETEDFAERRLGLENPQVRAVEIERDQNWIIELVTLDAAGAMSILENGRVRFVKSFTGADSAGGNNLILRGGATVVFTVTTAANLFVQVRVSQPRPARHLTAAFPLASVTPNGSGAPFSNAGRHSPGDVTIRQMGDAGTGADQGV